MATLLPSLERLLEWISELRTELKNLKNLNLSEETLKTRIESIQTELKMIEMYQSILKQMDSIGDRTGEGTEDTTDITKSFGKKPRV
jgi:hypothetical protein